MKRFVTFFVLPLAVIHVEPGTWQPHADHPPWPQSTLSSFSSVALPVYRALPPPWFIFGWMRTSILRGLLVLRWGSASGQRSKNFLFINLIAWGSVNLVSIALDSKTQLGGSRAVGRGCWGSTTGTRIALRLYFWPIKTPRKKFPLPTLDKVNSRSIYSTGSAYAHREN